VQQVMRQIGCERKIFCNKSGCESNASTRSSRTEKISDVTLSSTLLSILILIHSLVHHLSSVSSRENLQHLVLSPPPGRMCDHCSPTCCHRGERCPSPRLRNRASPQHGAPAAAHPSPMDACEELPWTPPLGSSSRGGGGAAARRCRRVTPWSHSPNEV
jgi:hypothetical protein